MAEKATFYRKTKIHNKKLINTWSLSNKMLIVKLNKELINLTT